MDHPNDEFGFFTLALVLLAAAVASDPPERTALILVGQVLAAEDFRDSALYDASYRRRYRSGGAP